MLQASQFQILLYFSIPRCESCCHHSTNTPASTVSRKARTCRYFPHSRRYEEVRVRHSPAQKKPKDILTQSQPLPSVFPFVDHFFSLLCQLQQLFLDLDGEEKARPLPKHRLTHLTMQALTSNTRQNTLCWIVRK